MAILTLGPPLLKKLRDGYEVDIYRVVGATHVDLVADVLIADGALTLAAQPSYTAVPVFFVTDGDAGITALDATIVGADRVGVAQTEAVSLDNGGAGGTISVAAANAYSRIDSITLANAAGNGAGDNVSVGTALIAADDFHFPVYGSYQAGIFATEADWIKRSSARSAVVDVLADQATDASGVVIEESLDGVTVHRTTLLPDRRGALTVAAAVAMHHVVGLQLPYWRFRWQNGATDQNALDVRVAVAERVADSGMLLVSSGTSASGAAQTVSTPASDREIEVTQFVVRYSAAAAVNVLGTLNSILGAAFDTQLVDAALAAQQDVYFVFDVPLLLAPGDALDVLCPALAAQTSQAAIYGKIQAGS